MTEHSLAAQVMIAVTHVYQEHGGDPPARAITAAALRALATRGEAVEIRTAPGFAEIDEVIRVSDICATADEIKAQ